MKLDVDALMRQLKEHAPVEMGQVDEGKTREFLLDKTNVPSRSPNGQQR